MGPKKLYALVSGIFLVPGIISLILFGLKPSIDFTGGTLWEVKVVSEGDRAISEEIGSIFAEQGLEAASIQPSGEAQVIVRAAPLSSDQHNQLLQAMNAELGEVTEIRFETLGPTLGRELLRKTALAVILALLVILAYVAYRFGDIMFGATAVLGMIHDTVVLMGVFSLLGHFWGVEVGTLFVTAVLTTLSFSVHDTIVVFDRVREISNRSSLGLEEAANLAVGETIVRSINNSLTIVFMLLALLLLGGESLRWFILALLVGTISGTYSSTFVAAPLLTIWARFRRR